VAPKLYYSKCLIGSTIRAQVEIIYIKVVYS